MKKLLLLPLAFVSLVTFAQQKKKAVKVAVDSAKAVTKYTDNIDDRMKGPNGEKVYIGPNGGRYYMKGDKKVYLATNIKKKKG